MTTQLVLNQRGSSLSVSGGRYRVRTREREFFVAAHEVSSIVLHATTRLSHEVVMTAIEQQTDILFADRRGFPTGRVWSNRFGSIATIRKHQLAFSQRREGGDWVRGLLLRKLDNQVTVIDLLAALSGQRTTASRTGPTDYYALWPENTGRAYRSPQRFAQRLFCYVPGAGRQRGAGVLFAVEHVSANAYRFERRSGRGATDAFNCLLNYAYGMLYGQCESALITAGVDPFVGVMHRDEYNRPVLTYDFIEPFRAWADYVVCHLLMQEVVFDEFFDAETGQLYLNTSGKRVLIQAMNDYLAEVVTWAPAGRSRGQHIVLEAQQLARYMKKLTVPTE